MALRARRYLEVADFDEDCGAFGFGEGLVMAQVWAADPRAGGISTVLIAEDAFEDVDFLAADVGVGIEPRHGRPTDQGRMLREAFMERTTHKRGQAVSGRTCELNGGLHAF